MKQHWDTFRKLAWEARLPRERQLIAAAAAILAPALVYYVLWQPAHRSVAKLQSALPVMRAQAEQMKQQAEEVEMLRQHPQPAVMDSSALKAVVEASAVQFQLRDAIERIDAMEPNGVRVAFPSVAYARWLRWVHRLQQEQHVRVASLDVAALPSTGMAKINVTLVNGTAP